MSDANVFFISPFGKNGSVRMNRSNYIIEEIISPVLSKNYSSLPYELELIRGDTLSGNSDVFTKLIDYIAKSRFVIVDNAYNNPNVFFEATVAWVLKKPAIYLNSEIESQESIPFNLSHLDHIILPDNWSKYEYHQNLLKNKIEKCRRDLEKKIYTILKEDYTHYKPIACETIGREILNKYINIDEFEKLKAINKAQKNQIEILEAKIEGIDDNDKIVREFQIYFKKISKNKNDTSAKVQMINILQSLISTQPSFVIEKCNEILKINSSIIEVLFIKGQCMYSLKGDEVDKNQILEVFNQILEISPNHKEAYQYLKKLK